LATDPTKTGLQFEAHNDFHSARKCYAEALNKDWGTQEVSKAERELWEQLMLRCCRELTDWKAMRDWTTGRDG
jgi:hypothetical protein